MPTPSEEALRALLAKVQMEIGWRGRGAKDVDHFYCEFCKESHIDSNLIPHTNRCLVEEVRAALSSSAPVSEAKRQVACGLCGQDWPKEEAP